MATISSMTNNTYLMYNYAQKNGVSLFGSASAARTPSASSLYGSSSSASDMGSLSSIKTGYSGLVSSYEETKSTFNAEMKGDLSDLSRSAQKVQTMDYGLTSADITTKDDGTKTYSSALKTALDNVKQFVSDYNDTADFFTDNASVSSRTKGLASAFSSPLAGREDAYAAIGITQDTKTGKLTLDEDKLATALTSAGDAQNKLGATYGERYASGENSVQYLLGKNGLTGAAEKNVSLAQFQGDKIFPSATQMFGGETTVASLYTGSTLLNISGYATTGNLLNMMF